MELPVVITLIICGTVVLITIMALIFAGWVITKGVAMSEKKDDCQQKKHFPQNLKN
ncbi:hypothetical protein ACFL52_02510 [Candidatus Margulisiibacteriota bacterium]